MCDGVFETHMKRLARLATILEQHTTMKLTRDHMQDKCGQNATPLIFAKQLVKIQFVQSAMWIIELQLMF